MKDLFKKILCLIWIIDILNISFAISNFDLATFLDITLPINGLFWLLVWIFI